MCSINTESTAAQEMKYAALPAQMTENYPSREASVSSASAPQEYDQPKQEPTIVQDGPSFSAVQTTSNSTFGLVPQMLGSQFAPLESPETQPRDDTRIPSFVVRLIVMNVVYHLTWSNFCLTKCDDNVLYLVVTFYCLHHGYLL